MVIKINHFTINRVWFSKSPFDTRYASFPNYRGKRLKTSFMHVGSHEKNLLYLMSKDVYHINSVYVGSKFQPIEIYYLLKMYNETEMKTT